MEITWGTADKLIDLVGLTKSQINSKIDRDVWTRGVHFTVVDSLRWYNVEKIQLWIQKTCPEESTFDMDGCDTEKSSPASATKKRRPSHRLQVR